jgi:hypothetical protein
MKNSAIAPETVDPYATLETILKIIGRSWLTEEWRLEDIRILAQTAIAQQQDAGKTRRGDTRTRPTHTQAKPQRQAYTQATGTGSDRIPLSP